MRRGAKPISFLDRRLRRRRVCPAEPPREPRRHRARALPGVPSGRLASFPGALHTSRSSVTGSHSAHLPGARVLLLLVTSVRGAGDQVEAGFPAGRRPNRRNLRRSPGGLAPSTARAGRARAARKGSPLSWVPQSPRPHGGRVSNTTAHEF